MDKLGTYALVAALKEISRKQQPDNTNERWVSLRSCMTSLKQTSIEPTVQEAQSKPPAAQAAPQTAPQAAPRTAPRTAPPPAPRRSFTHIRQIDQRHQEARRRAP